VRPRLVIDLFLLAKVGENFELRSGVHPAYALRIVLRCLCPTFSS
jgi:hypothetical protein